MQADSKRHLIAAEYLMRVSAGLVFINVERLGGAVLKLTPESIYYYLMAMALTIALPLAMLRMGKLPLIRDLQDICLYDFLVQCYGLALFLHDVPKPSYWIMANGVWLLKFLRIMWWGKNQHGDLLFAWPVFGFLGYFSPHRFTEPLAPSQKWLIYASCLIPFGVALLSWRLLGSFPAEFVHALTFFGVLIFVKRVAADIQTREDERLAKITENAQLEAQTKMDAQLKERNIELRDATHDMRSPITAMIFQVQAIAKSNDLAQIHTSAQHIEAGLHELAQLQVEIIEMAKVTTQLITPTDQTIYLEQIGTILLERFDDIAADRNINLPIENTPFFVTSNAWLLERILSNLINNAIVHGHVRTSVGMNAQRVGNDCHIWVWDSGYGMPHADSTDHAANFLSLMGVIHLESAKTKAKDNDNAGHGIGLRSVMRMCKTLGISMLLFSRQGKGSVFHFYLPLAEASRAQPIETQEEDAFAAIMAKLR
ncbi:MAG: hypothetical protein RL748_2881 [Pseudomonadota bacterium]|jgi:signal transduction histidine kinase